MTTREIEVIGISLSILDHVKYFKTKNEKEKYIEWIAQALDFLPDSKYIPKDQRVHLIQQSTGKQNIDSIYRELKKWFLCVRRARKFGHIFLTEQ